MNLCVGIVGEQSGWKLLLEQEGVPHAADGVLSPEQYSVLVVSDNVDTVVLNSIKTYLTEGGAVLCSGKVFSRLTNSSGRESYIKYISDENNSLLTGIGLIDVCADCSIPSGATMLKTDTGISAVALAEYGKGYVIALPFDAGEIICCSRVSRKSFYTQRSRLPFERVSSVSRDGIRKLVTRSLELLHHRRGLPYVHLWYYPMNAQSIFSFRVDTDFATASEIDSLYNVAKKYSIPFTWFVHVKAQEQFLKRFKEMDGHETGVHCYDHLAYDDVGKNTANISKAIKNLESAGCSPKGFAAPYGTWNAAMAQAIRQFDFEYSSEFSYDYDNLPSYPLADDGLKMTLQVPVHPISIGSLRRQSFASEEMKSYFADILIRKYHRRDSLFFYHHPKNAHHEVLESMFEFVKQHEIPVMKMIDFARWWKQRDRVKPAVRYDGSMIRVDLEYPDERVWLRVTRHDGTESFVPMKQTIDMKSIEWKPRPAALPLPDDIARSRKFNPYIVINNIEDAIHNVLFPKS